MPATQTEHTLPQPPQLFLSVSVLTQTPSHNVRPALHVTTHSLPTQLTRPAGGA